MRNVKKQERGQSIVELSMSLVLMLTLLAGVVDFGRAFFTWITLRDAAQEGASFASIKKTNYLTSTEDVENFCDDITTRVLITTEDLSGGVSNPVINLSEMDITVDIFFNGKECGSATPTDVCNDNQNTVMITVNYDDFPLTTPFLGTIIGSQVIPLSASVEDKILTPACEYEIP